MTTDFEQSILALAGLNDEPQSVRTITANGPSGYGAYVLNPDGSLGDFIANTQAPLRSSPPGQLREPSGQSSVADLLAIPGAQKQGSVITVPSATGGGYLDRYEINTYFPDYADFSTSFKPAQAAASSGTVHTSYITLANGDRQIYNKDLLDQGVPAAQALMRTEQKSGNIIQNPGYKGPGTAQTPSATTTAPRPTTTASMGSATSPQEERVPATVSQDYTGDVPVDALVRTTQGYAPDPRRGMTITPGGGITSGGEQGPQGGLDEYGYAQGVSPGPGGHEYSVGTAPGGTPTIRTRGGAERPSAVRGTIREATGDLTRIASGQSADIDAEELNRAIHQAELAASVRAPAIGGRDYAAAARARVAQIDLDRLKSAAHSAGIPGYRFGGQVVTDQPAGVFDLSTGEPLALISEYGNQTFPQPESLDLSQDGEMQVTPMYGRQAVPMANGGSVISYQASRPNEPNTGYRPGSFGPPRIGAKMPDPVRGSTPVTPMPGENPHGGGYRPPSRADDASALMASTGYNQWRQQQDALGIRDQLAGINRQYVPVSYGSQGNFSQPPAPGQSWEMPDLGSQIVNYTNQVTMLPPGEEYDATRDQLRSRIQQLRQLIPTFYGGGLPVGAGA